MHLHGLSVTGRITGLSFLYGLKRLCPMLSWVVAENRPFRAVCGLPKLGRTIVSAGMVHLLLLHVC